MCTALWDNGVHQQHTQQWFSMHADIFEQCLILSLFQHGQPQKHVNSMLNGMVIQHRLFEKWCREWTLKYNSPGFSIVEYFTFKYNDIQQKITFYKSQNVMPWVFTWMELERPLKGSACVKNSVLWSIRPWPPYWAASESSLILYLAKIEVKAQ